MTSARDLTDYDDLSTPEKILRLQDLWDEIASDPDQIKLTASQRDDLAKRLTKYRSGGFESRPWAEVREGIPKGQ